MFFFNLSLSKKILSQEAIEQEENQYEEELKQVNKLNI